MIKTASNKNEPNFGSAKYGKETIKNSFLRDYD